MMVFPWLYRIASSSQTIFTSLHKHVKAEFSWARLTEGNRRWRCRDPRARGILRSCSDVYLRVCAWRLMLGHEGWGHGFVGMLWHRPVRLGCADNEGGSPSQVKVGCAHATLLQCLRPKVSRGLVGTGRQGNAVGGSLATGMCAWPIGGARTLKLGQH